MKGKANNQLTDAQKDFLRSFMREAWEDIKANGWTYEEFAKVAERKLCSRYPGIKITPFNVQGSLAVLGEVHGSKYAKWPANATRGAAATSRLARLDEHGERIELLEQTVETLEARLHALNLAFDKERLSGD